AMVVHKQEEPTNAEVDNVKLFAKLQSLQAWYKDPNTEEGIKPDIKVQKAIDTYLYNYEQNPLLVQKEDYLLKVVMMYAHVRVLIGTIDKCLGIMELLRDARLMVVDESGQARHVDIHMLVGGLRLTQLLLVGDHFQLRPHRQMEVPERCYDFLNFSVAEHFKRHVVRATLNLVTGYRAHPCITEASSVAVYSGTVMSGLSASERAGVTGSNFPLARKGYPVLLLHSEEVARLLITRSRCNETQCTLAYEILRMLGHTTQGLTVVVNCFYQGDVNYCLGLFDKEEQAVKRDMGHLKSVTVRTVDSYIGQEADVNIIITGQTQETTGAQHVLNQERANVAVTRGRHATIIIGNVKYLTKEVDGEDHTFKRFVEFALDRAPALDAGMYEMFIRDLRLNNFSPRYDADEYQLISETGYQYPSKKVDYHMLVSTIIENTRVTKYWPLTMDEVAVRAAENLEELQLDDNTA
ncbi:MAG TPA: AAA domain-containing protein, partial [Puia sp.]|nr:AAA domain-containing protein [Puia sp.]